MASRILKLLEKISDDNDEIREKATAEIRELFKSKEFEDAIPELVDELGNVNSKSRKNIPWALGQVAKEGVNINLAINPLLEFLYIDDGHLPETAGYALANASVDPGIRKIVLDEVGICLYHKEARVRLASIRTFYWISQEYGNELEEFVPDIMKSIDDEIEIRNFAIMSLGCITTEKQAGEVIEKLMEIDDVLVIDALGDIAKRGIDVSRAIATATKYLDSRYSTDYEPAFNLLYAAIKNKKSRKKAVASIKKLLVKKGKTANGAVAAMDLVQYAAENGEEISECIHYIIDYLSSGVWNVNEAAAAALSKFAELGLDIAPAIPALLKATNSENSTAKYAAHALGHASKKEDIAPYIESFGAQALYDKDHDTQVNAIWVLCRIYETGSDEIKTRILERLEKVKNSDGFKNLPDNESLLHDIEKLTKQI